MWTVNLSELYQLFAVHSNTFEYFWILSGVLKLGAPIKKLQSYEQTRQKRMCIRWSVLVVNHIPGYSISLEIWAICPCFWCYQLPTGIKRSARGWLSDQCMNAGSYLIPFSNNFELKVNNLFPSSSALKKRQLKGGMRICTSKSKDTHCAGWLASSHSR